MTEATRSQPGSAALANASALPALLTKQQACEFLRVSGRTLDRRLADGTICSTRLGRSRSSPVRILRDCLLRDLGLVEPAGKVRRDRGRGEQEFFALAARLGINAGGERDDGGREL